MMTQNAYEMLTRYNDHLHILCSTQRIQDIYEC